LFRTAQLSSNHYASKFKMPKEDSLNNRDVVNELGIKYAKLTDGSEKETVLLEILTCFHGYIMKYVNMVVRGHLPPLKSPAGKESMLFLKMLIPKGQKKSGRLEMMSVCRTLHLAFKQMTADDIYDTLVLCVMRAIKKYDPFYTDKVGKVCRSIDARCNKKRRKVSAVPEFTAEDLTRDVGFDSTGCLRMLVRKKFLASIAGPKKKVIGYKRNKTWPPPREFFESGPVGFVYFLPMYFRWYLHEYISTEMASIESKEGMLQLGHGPAGATDSGPRDHNTPHAEGALVDRDGTSWAADMTLLSLPLDISEMSIEWVSNTDDKLFRKLTKKERHLLYMIYVLEYKWVEIAAVLDCDTQTARKQFDQVISYLRAKAKVKK
jgi:hypothetical protein